MVASLSLALSNSSGIFEESEIQLGQLTFLRTGQQLAAAAWLSNRMWDYRLVVFMLKVEACQVQYSTGCLRDTDPGG